MSAVGEVHKQSSGEEGSEVKEKVRRKKRFLYVSLSVCACTTISFYSLALTPAEWTEWRRRKEEKA